MVREMLNIFPVSSSPVSSTYIVDGVDTPVTLAAT